MERKYNIDLLRILSAIAVVIIHSITSPVSNSTAAVSSTVTTVLHCIHNLMNWSVPVFFAITGYCVLCKQTYTYKQSFPHVLKYVAVLLTVGFGYALLEQVAAVKTIRVSVILSALKNVVTGNLWDHMWYIYAVIGIYLVLPVIHNFMQTGKKERLILTGLLFLFTIVLPSMEQWVTVGVDFPFGGFLFYVCLGGVIAKGDLGKKAKIIIISLGAASLTWMLVEHNEDFGYRSLPVSLLAASILIGFDNISIKPRRMLLTVSQCTWGIYLLHPLFLNILVKVLQLDFVSHLPYLRLSALAIVMFLVSFGATYLLRKIPLIKKLF